MKPLNGIRIPILLIVLTLTILGFQNCGEVNISDMSSEAPFEVTTTTAPESTTSTTLQTPTTAPPCGSYRIDKESYDQSGNLVFRFRVSKETNGVFTQISPNPLSWTSSYPGNSNDQNATYTISDPPRNCSANTVSARIVNECGNEQEIPLAFTRTGCPEPQIGDVACVDRHKVPDSSSLTTGWFQLPGGAPWKGDTNLSSLRLALGISPSVTLISGGGNIFLNKNKYLQFAFKTTKAPAGTTATNRKFELGTDSSGIFGPPGISSGTCPMVYAISDCPGDFYIGRDPKGCVSPYSGANGLLAVFDAVPADNLAAHICKLESGKTYYLNVSAQNPMNNWQYPHEDATMGCMAPIIINLNYSDKNGP